MSAGTGDEYRPTYFDKHGPEGADHGGLVGALLGGAGSALFVISMSEGMGTMFGEFIQPNRSPYERQYSYEDSLVMRGDVEGALASYEKIIAEAPNDPQPRIRAARCSKGRHICFQQARRHLSRVAGPRDERSARAQAPH